MKARNAMLLMFGIMFLVVILSISLIFLESDLPVLLILTLGLIYVIIIDLILLKKSKTPKRLVYKNVNPQIKDNFGDVYNHLLKTSIDLNEKLEKLNKREQQLKKIAEDANKTLNLSQNFKNNVKHIKPQRKFVASVLSNKFHSNHCKFTKLISAKNKVFFNTKTQALKQGYKPCNELKR